MLNLRRSYHKLKRFQCDRTAHKKSALSNTLSLSSENYFSTNSSPPILYLLLSHLEKKFSYLTSTNLYIIVTTDVTNAGREATTNLLRMLQNKFPPLQTISDKSLETLWKILLNIVSLLPLQCLCSHVTLQSHLNIAEGKGTCKGVSTILGKDCSGLRVLALPIPVTIESSADASAPFQA